MRLAERLLSWDGKDAGFLREVFDLHGHRDDFVAQVLEAMEGPALAQTGGTWALKRWLETGARLGPGDAAKVFARLKHLDPWEAQLHLLQSMHWLVIPDRSRRAVEAFVRAALDSEVKFVRAWAFSGLHELARSFDELRPESEALMEAAMEAGPASVRARIRNVRKRGYPEGPPPGPV